MQLVEMIEDQEMERDAIAILDYLVTESRDRNLHKDQSPSPVVLSRSGKSLEEPLLIQIHSLLRLRREADEMSREGQNQASMPQQVLAVADLPATSQRPRVETCSKQATHHDVQQIQVMVDLTKSHLRTQIMVV